MQRAEEPPQDEEGSLLGVWFRCRGNKESRVLRPVRRVFDEGGGGEDEGWSGQRRQVTVEGSNRLKKTGEISHQQETEDVAQDR